MVIAKSFFRGNLLSPHKLLFSMRNKGSYICMFPQAGQHIPQPLMDQLWTDHWLERKIAQPTYGSAMQNRSAMQEDPKLPSWVLYHLIYVPPLYMEIMSLSVLASITIHLFSLWIYRMRWLPVENVAISNLHHEKIDNCAYLFMGSALMG